jgi:1,4-dihydroxy-2-naphthoyl-CoA synthase
MAATISSSAASYAYENIRVTKNNGVGLLTLARATKLNSWTAQLYDDVIDAITRLANDEEVCTTHTPLSPRLTNYRNVLSSTHIGSGSNDHR